VKKIKQITSEETLVIRHTAMWPDKPLEYVKLPNDDDGRHYGLFLDTTLISVISFFKTKEEAQFRKFATLDTYQSKGYGSILLKEIMNIAERENLTRIWCNARKNKSDFYAKFGMKATDNTFHKGGISYVVMERKFT
jgi:predicted GNAT family N-acyltransferase